MAKKYAQTRKDREDERRGMERYWRDERKDSKGRYRDLDEIKEDRSEIANLPRRSMQFEVGCGVKPKKYSYDDTMSGIDDLGDQNVRKVNDYMDYDD